MSSVGHLYVFFGEIRTLFLTAPWSPRSPSSPISPHLSVLTVRWQIGAIQESVRSLIHISPSASAESSSSWPVPSIRREQLVRRLCVLSICVRRCYVTCSFSSLRYTTRVPLTSPHEFPFLILEPCTAHILRGAACGPTCGLSRQRWWDSPGCPEPVDSPARGGPALHSGWECSRGMRWTAVQPVCLCPPAPNPCVEALISSVIMFGEGPSKEVTNGKGGRRPGTDLIDLMTLWDETCHLLHTRAPREGCARTAWEDSRLRARGIFFWNSWFLTRFVFGIFWIITWISESWLHLF